VSSKPWWSIISYSELMHRDFPEYTWYIVRTIGLYILYHLRWMVECN
jgi:hypothetical protein